MNRKATRGSRHESCTTKTKATRGRQHNLRTDVPTDVPTPVMEEKNFLLEPTSTTGRGSAARPRPRPGDACRSIAPRTDVSQIGRNRVAVAGTPWKLRTDVPTDVPTAAMAAGSDSERRGKLLAVGVALRTLPFFWYGIFNPVYVSSDFHIGQNHVLDASIRRKLGMGRPLDVTMHYRIRISL